MAFTKRNQRTRARIRRIILADTVRLGVIGAGYWGKKVIQEYTRLSKNELGLDLPIISDLKEDNLNYCNEVLKIPKENLTLDYMDMINSEDIDAIHICTKNGSHYNIGRQVLDSKKHVLIEKPMTMNSREALELRNIAASESLVLKVGHIYRFNNAIGKLGKLTGEGYFGEIYCMNFQWVSLIESPSNTDIIYDLAPHPVDISNDLLDRWPTRVQCKAKPYRRESLEEHAFITMEYEDNLMVHIELSWLSPWKTRQITIVGSDRCARIDSLNQTIEIHENSDNRAFSLDVIRNNTIYDEVKNFVETIRAAHLMGAMSCSFLNDAPNGLNNVTVLEHLRTSLEQDRTVRIDYKE